MKKSRGSKLLCILLSVAMVSAFIPAVCISAFAAAWGGGTAAPAMNSDGYYLIDSGEKLAWFSQRVNSGYTTINAKQTADIDMGKRAFTPIGTAANVFKGIYDGQGHSISNLVVNSSGEGNGLFGYIGTTVTVQTETDEFGDTVSTNIYTPSEVNEVILVNANITGGKNTGAVAGVSDGGYIYGCQFTGTVTGTSSNIGGIVGYNKRATIVNCLNDGIVTSTTLRVGGISGYNYSNSYILGCCNTGTVSAGSYVGGIVGTNSGSTVSHCYNKGTVSATTNTCGGLVGYVAYGEIARSYAIGPVNCPGAYTGIVFGNVVYGSDITKCYFDRDNSALSDNYATPAENVLMTNKRFIDTLNVNYNIFVKDYFKANKGYPLLRWQLVAWNGGLTKPSTNSSGTYLISTGSELAWFSALVNGTLADTPQNPSANAVLTNDILINPELFDETSNIWSPMGSEAIPYNGTFDGKSYRISGIYTLDTEAINVGLFGYIGTSGIVRNLFIETSKINGYRYVGAVAGYNNGTITNCFNYASINGTYYVGGITGHNSGTVTNCGNIGDVYGSNYSGGITGYNSGTVSLCFNNGPVGGVQRTGGIAGSNYLTVHDCYNTGKVDSGSHVGGIVGYQGTGTVSTCYNTGTVSAINSYLGAVIGNLANGTISYCHYATDSSGATDASATGKTLLELAEPTLVGSLTGFNATYWVDRAPDQYFNYLPELKVFYNSSNELLQTTSRESAAVLKSIYVVKAEVDGEMDTYYPSLNQASAHIGEGEGTLVIIAPNEITNTVVIEGTVTITDDGTKRTISRSSGAIRNNLFSVDGVLLLKSTSNSEENPTLTVDGGHSNGYVGNSAVFVESSGTFAMYPGTVITSNYSESNGGGIYVDGGALGLYGGKVCSNEAPHGAGIYNYAGTVYAEAGTVCNNTATGNGGGIYFEGKYAEVELTGTFAITGNSAVNGGGIYNPQSTLTISSLTVSDNVASQNGGGIYNTGTLDITGCTLSGNTAGVSGNGVYENGTFNLSGTPFFNENNDICLASGKAVINTQKITTSGIVAYLTVNDYQKGTRVLSGEFCASNYAKFVLNVPDGAEQLYINSTGYLVDKEISNIAKVSEFGAYDIYYTSLKEAVDAIGEGTGLITMLGDDTISEPVTVKGNITIVGDKSAENGVRITRYYTCEDAMFIVENGASLDFGVSGTETDTILYVDGGGELYGTYGSHVVNNAGTFNINDGVTVINAKTDNNGAVVHNTGEVNVKGGTVTGCSASNGGFAYSASGTITMTGGTVSNCSATNGGAVCLGGTSVFKAQSGTVTNCSATNGGAVYADKNTSFRLEGTTVTENNATNGGGAYVSGGTMTMPGGKISVVTEDENGESVFTEVDVSGTLSNNTAAARGGGIYILSGTAELSIGEITGNSAVRGGGVCLSDGTEFSVKGGTFSGNTASLYGNGIFCDGTVSMYADTAFSATDDVYLCYGNTIDIKETFSEGTDPIATIVPENYEIGLTVLTGSDIETVNSRVHVSNNVYFVNYAGILETNSITMQDDSYMTVNYEDGIIFGIDTENNTVSEAMLQIENDATSLVFTAPDGTVLSESDALYTGCKVELYKYGSPIDMKTYSLIGDTDRDGQFSATDAVIINCIAAGMLDKSTLGADAYRAADADNNGTIDSVDADLLRACGMLDGTIAQP